MKYTSGEVQARVGFVISDREPRILTWESGGCHPASIAECALWDALAERIEADEGAVPCGYLITWNDQSYRGKQSLSFDRCHPDDGAFVPVFTHPPAQAAQSVDIGAIREVIESHINEAKKLRHDPESQDYLYEQADKLTAALQESGNG